MENFNFSEKKLYKPFSNDLENYNAIYFLKKVLKPEKNLLIFAMVYGLMISLLGLATPLSVQLLINSVSFTALLQPIIVLGLVLLILLVSSGFLNAMQFYVAEIFQRKFFARLTSEITLRLIYSNYKAMEESNGPELVNRFFDVITIQKSVPKFITKTFAVILQSFLGLVLIAFYHPIFLIFSLSLTIAIFFICKIYAQGAIKSSFYESRRKYDLAAWLEDIARNNIMFKSDIGQNYAKYKVDFLTNQYLKERKKHFKNLFAQNILLLALYAFASSFLLILGGFLVLKGQLTLGQLVAAELIVSTVLYGISRLGADFESFYDLLSACEKLTNFYNIPLDVRKGKNLEGAINVKFKNVKDCAFGKNYIFNFEFRSGKNYLIATKHASTQRILIELINGLRLPNQGLLEFNDHDVSDIDLFNLRSKISIIDNSDFLEGTVLEYLTFNSKKISQKQINEVLEITGLDLVLSRFEEGVNLRIIPSGWPFSESEKLLLKTARTLLLEPKIIIITEVFDMLNLAMRQRIIKYLTKDHDACLIYFSNRRDEFESFDFYGFVDYEKMINFTTIEELHDYEKRF